MIHRTLWFKYFLQPVHRDDRNDYYIIPYQNMPMGIVKYSNHLQIFTQHQVLFLVINNDVLSQLKINYVTYLQP